MTEQPQAKQLRADARRNVEGIRQAALEVFRDSGLGTPLDDVARAAGVSKGTIYHRFGSRQGLIDAIVEELVAERFQGIVTRVQALDDPGERLESYLRQVWLLQFDEPAANDVLLRTMPDSDTVRSLCDHLSDVGEQLLFHAQAAGAIRSDLTSEDLYLLIWERGLIARACEAQTRESYQRRFEYTLAGLRVG